MNLHNRELTFNARKLRKNMTRQERRLWFEFLRPYPVKFQTQKIIDSFIVDFYCAKAKLIIEIDGSQHYGVNKRKSKDVYRDDCLQGLGYSIIRIDNYMIDNRFSEICDYLDFEIRKSIEEYEKS